MIFVPNIVETNGKTIRQNNMETKHSIPIGTLVEVDISYSPHHGIRAFVCEHTRDCDGTPLYALYHSNDMESLFYVKTINKSVYRYMICDGFSEDCLKIVKPV